MLTPDVRLEGFTTEDWLRLIDVLRPQRSRAREQLSSDDASAARMHAESAAPGVRSKGGVVAITTGERLRKLLSTERGRLDPRAEPWPAPLEQLAARHEASWALVLHTGALDELMDRFGERLRREHDLLDQALILIGALRELEAEGAISAWPWSLSSLPVPYERILLRAFDAFCPDGKAVLFGVFEQGELATCIVARRRGSGFDWIVGPDELRRDMGLVSGDWTRDYRHLVRAAELRVGPLALGCFGDMHTFRHLVERPSPGAWAAAVAGRDVIVSPIVPAIAIPLGVDVGRAALATVRGLADRIGASGWLGSDGVLGPALDRVRELTVFDRDLESLLGFDPIQLLRRLFVRREDRDES